MPNVSPAQHGSRRRKERRQQVQLRGKLRCGGRTYPVQIGDLSLSGAFVLVKEAPKAGTNAELWIENHGPIAVEIRHSGDYFCGVEFANPLEHRNVVWGWLRQDEIRRELVGCGAGMQEPVA
jgi:hypothetical protein